MARLSACNMVVTRLSAMWLQSNIKFYNEYTCAHKTGWTDLTSYIDFGLSDWMSDW